MASSSMSALRLASGLLSTAQTLTRSLRLDTKRNIYLSASFQKKKRKNSSSSSSPTPAEANGFLNSRDDNAPKRQNLVNENLINAPKRQNLVNENLVNAPKRQSLVNASKRQKGFVDVEIDCEPIDYEPAALGLDRKFSPEESNRSSPVKIQSLMDVIRVRREQATRTLLFAPDLHNAANPCPRYMRHKIESYVGRVRHVALTSVISSSKSDNLSLPSKGDDQPFVRRSLLVEFEDLNQMNKLIRHFSQPFPGHKANYSNRLLYCHGHWSQSDALDSPMELSDALNACNNVSDQIRTLMKKTELDDVGIRARFFLCDVIESLIKAIFPGCRVVPFGSTVSGLGRADSDMDIVLTLPSNEIKQGRGEQRELRPFSAFSIKSADMTDSKSVVVRQLGLIHEIVRFALPGYCEFIRIFRANVPILAFKHSYTNLCCDFSVQSTDSLLAAQLFNTYTQLDPRVRPLLFALRRWSISQNLSTFVTNFPLCCLALFYLMEQKVVPPMNTLEGNTDHVSTIPMNIRWKSSNSASMEDLLLGFFQFYSQFNFGRNAISVFLGKQREKVTTDGVEVENPLDREMNCARLIEHNKMFPAFQNAIVSAASTLQERRTPEVGGSSWGLSGLIESRKDVGLLDVSVDLGDDPEMALDGDIHHSPGGGGGGGGMFTQRIGGFSPPPNRQRHGRGADLTKDGQVMRILSDIFKEEGAADSGVLEETNFSLTSYEFVEDDVDAM